MPVPLAEAELASKPVSAVMVLLRPAGSGLEVLLGRRTQRPGDPWSGQISFPGGHRHKEDSSLLATALRETQEEVNLDLEGRADIVGHMAPRSPGNVPEMLVVPFVAVATAVLTPRPGPEMEETFWTPLEELPPSREQAIVQTRVGELRMPAYRWKRHLIWGLTYRILEELLILVGVSH
jgi:8-oxo-dGTP pyrophosphatase MutT (NUDIX family)